LTYGGILLQGAITKLSDEERGFNDKTNSLTVSEADIDLESEADNQGA